MTIEEVKQLIKDNIKQKEELSDYFAERDDGASLAYYREASTLKSLLYDIEEREQDA